MNSKERKRIDRIKTESEHEDRLEAREKINIEREKINIEVRVEDRVELLSLASNTTNDPIEFLLSHFL